MILLKLALIGCAELHARHAVGYGMECPGYERAGEYVTAYYANGATATIF